MFSKLREFFLGLGSETFEQDQNEAILTMLVWVMQADGKLEPTESSKISEFIAAVRWTAERSPIRFIRQAQDRVAKIDAGTLTEEALLQECAAKLKTSDIRYKAVDACRELAKADGYFDTAERHLLDLFTKTLIYDKQAGVP